MNHEAKLHDYLFSCNGTSTSCFLYNPVLRPVKNSNEKLLVNIRLGIKRIFEMDEATHKLTLFALLYNVNYSLFLKKFHLN